MFKTPPYITLTSDFQVQSQGVGAMEAQIFRICPVAKVVHLMHGLKAFDLRAGARTLETLDTHPLGAHVCVVDPGVGTERNPIAIKTVRGDYLIGPDNGVLIPAARSFLGGISSARKIENRKFMRDEVSPLFHGRDLFAPTAAHLANGERFEELGDEIPIDLLHPSPYEEAKANGSSISAEIIQINGFGSLHLNITHDEWDKLPVELGSKVKAKFLIGDKSESTKELIYARTFGDVPKGSNVVMKDDYGRVEIAKNLGRFVDEILCNLGDKVIISSQTR